MTAKSKREPRKPPLAEWPAKQPTPTFANPAEEDRFWGEHSFADLMNERGEEVTYEPQATRRPRTRVYRVRLTDEEMATLQALAKGRGVTGSVVLRDYLRKQAIARRAKAAAGKSGAVAGTAVTKQKVRSAGKR